MSEDPTERFTVDEDRMREWLAAKYEENNGAYERAFGGSEEPLADSEITFVALFGDEYPNRRLDETVYELIEAGIIQRPFGWTVAIYTLDNEDGWGFLPCLRSETEDRESLAFVQLTGLSDDVGISDEVVYTVDCVLNRMNRLLPAGRAAYEAEVARREEAR